MSESKIKKDWQGKPIPENERDETIVLAWEISPGSPGSGYDSAVIRDYHDASIHAKDVLDSLIDEANEADLLEHGITVKVKLVRWPVGDLKNLESMDEF